MNRRNLLKLGIFSVFSSLIDVKILKSQEKERILNLIRPAKLNKGDTVGVISPATSVTSPDDLQKAEEILNFLGLIPKFSKNLLINEGYKTHSVKSRVEDIHSMFQDNDIKGIFCVRGGYGSMGLLKYIDYKIIRDNPKVFVGYSDITALHISLMQKSGLVTLHGPMLLSEYSGNTVDFYKKALFTSEPLGEITNPKSSGVRDSNPIRVISPGKAQGKITGGNLSLICSLMGTEFEIDTNNKILFLEDVEEEPYRIDRMLTQLKLAGKFDKLKGIIFGKCQDCNQKSAPPIWDYSLGEVLDFQLKELNIPVMYGFLIGHSGIQYPIPYGTEVKMDTSLESFNILDSYCI